MTLDETHDPKRRSFVASANGHPDFPIQNLPLGVFLSESGEARTGIAIGDEILDIRSAFEAGLLEGVHEAAAIAPLNGFLALGSDARRALRKNVSELLSSDFPEKDRIRDCLRSASDCRIGLPVRIGDYTDFYVGIHHATAVGKLFRPDNPLLPNYKHVPIAYHGRASSILPSGVAVRRPNGQMKSPDAEMPEFGASRRLDYELELGVIIGEGNALGEPVPVGEARNHVAGFCLLNDWSARDIQAWEYQPLGPFLAKNFASTLSPWIVMPEALEPFRAAQPARAEGDPQPLPYLLDQADQAEGAFGLELYVSIVSEEMARAGLPPFRLAHSHSRHMYWTVAQMVAHHTSGGCNLSPGDLLGSGTLSGPDTANAGSLLEATQGGKLPVRLPSGEERRFVEDGDEIILTARAQREGFASIGFGECRAKVVAARRVGQS